MSSLRRVAGRGCAVYYFLRTLGKIKGRDFLLRDTSLIRVDKPGSVRLGKGAHIEKGARIVVTSSLYVGDNVYVGKNSTIVAMAPVTIERGVLIGENVSIHSEDHGPPGARSIYSVAPIYIGADSWIAAGVVILKGVTIGSRTTIGANAVVTKDVPSDALAYGVPAKVVGSR